MACSSARSVGWSGTGVTAISENAWHCVELHVAPPSASTAIQYWIDGTSAGTCTGAFSGNSTFTYMMFGDVALATSGSTNGTGTIYWDEVIVANYYIDPSAPSAPANVRDGTGADISTTASTTQLSANWDAATDADSGISGYQYAIGTSAGGTQTVNWTSLGNVTTVTADRLDVDRRPDLLRQRQGRQRRRTEQRRHEFQRPDGADERWSHRQARRPPYGMASGPISRQRVRPRSCRPTGTPVPIMKAASAAISMPSAPRPAARKP